MSQAPKSDPPFCDVPGCGATATIMTDGTETDLHQPTLNRIAIPYLNICESHTNWPFSEDAKAFTTDKDTAGKYAARVSKAKGK